MRQLATVSSLQTASKGAPWEVRSYPDEGDKLLVGVLVSPAERGQRRSSLSLCSLRLHLVLSVNCINTYYPLGAVHFHLFFF